MFYRSLHHVRRFFLKYLNKRQINSTENAWKRSSENQRGFHNNSDGVAILRHMLQ